MKRLWGTFLLLATAFCVSVPVMAEVDVNIKISLPPPIPFVAPPRVVVIPETYVYVDPDIKADLFFWNGFWWRLWEGHWYRARGYNQQWSHYNQVPSFYKSVPHGWRDHYRNRTWGGHPWNYKRIPHKDLQQNWSRWERDRHWEKKETWFVKGLTRKKTKKEIKHHMKEKKKEEHFERQKEHHNKMREFQREKHEDKKHGPDNPGMHKRHDGGMDSRGREDKDEHGRRGHGK